MLATAPEKNGSKPAAGSELTVMETTTSLVFPVTETPSVSVLLEEQADSKPPRERDATPIPASFTKFLLVIATVSPLYRKYADAFG